MYREAHLKRFFMEVYGDPSIYDDYLHGDAHINHDLYLKWLKDIDLRNMTFACRIKGFDRIHSKSIITESCLKEDCSVSSHFHNRSITTISNFGEFAIEKKELGDSTNHYICNGYFTDTLEQIYKVLDSGSFTVGICAEKKKDLYKVVVEYYGRLRSFLLKNGYQTSEVQTNVSSMNRVYLLMYDSKIKSKVK